MTTEGTELQDLWDHISGKIEEGSHSNCELGTVGWEGYEDHFEKGEATNDGHTLIRVQLYRGKGLHKAVKPGIAQGLPILAMLSSEMGRIPPKGSRAYVLLPTGMEQIPGAGVIVATVKPGREVNDNLGAGHATLASSSGAARITVKEDGSIVIFTTSDNTKDGMSVFLRLKKDGLEFVSPWGRLRFDDTGFHVKTVAGAEISMGSIGGLPSPLDVINSYIRLKAATVSAPCAIASVANPLSVPVPLADADTLKLILAAINVKLTAAGFAMAPEDAALILTINTNASASK